MPTPEQILEGLRRIANEWWVLAIAWHGYFGVIAFALAAGVRPSRRTMGVLLALPLLSVSVLAWLTGNPFNGSVFALVAFGLVGISRQLARGPVRIAAWWRVVPGVLMFMFGWIYPHFLETSSIVRYAYSAPTGLIPCPTLSIVVGIALIVGGLESRIWSLVAGVTGIFYGVFGAVRLGVTIDWFLVAGGVMLLFVGRHSRSHDVPSP